MGRVSEVLNDVSGNWRSVEVQAGLLIVHEVNGLAAASPSWPRLFAYRALYTKMVDGGRPGKDEERIMDGIVSDVGCLLDGIVGFGLNTARFHGRIRCPTVVLKIQLEKNRSSS